MELTLKQIFGDNCFQDSLILIIQKSDYLLLTPTANNTAESLLVALLLKAFDNFQGSLTDLQGNKITDNQGRTINYNNSALYENLQIERLDSFIKMSNNNYFVTDQFVINYESIVDYVDT